MLQTSHHEPRLYTLTSIHAILKACRQLLLAFMLVVGFTGTAVLAEPMQLPQSPQPSHALTDYFGLQERKIMRWHDQTRIIMVYIADGSSLSGWNPEYPNRVKAAFWAWEQVMAPRFHFIFMPDARGSDVTVQWVEKLSEGEGVAGVNECATWGKYIQRNDIKLATLGLDHMPNSPTGIQSVAQHEIGHMLGLKAHSDLPGDIMYPSLILSEEMGVHPISSRDILTLRKIYATKADYTNPPGYHLSNFEQFRKTQKGRHMSLLWIPVPGVPFPIPMIIPF